MVNGPQVKFSDIGTSDSWLNLNITVKKIDNSRRISREKAPSNSLTFPIY